MYSELILTIDTREQDKERIKAITDHFENFGAIVQNEKLDRCDYRVEGILKNIPVNLGIEHKVLRGDFFPSLADNMAGKLIESYKYFDDVALFIEEGEYAIKVTEDGADAYIQNDGMQAASGLNGVGTLASYNNFCGQLAKTSVHVRSYRSIAHFPLVVSGLLKSIIKPVHESIAVKNTEKEFYNFMINLMVTLPGVGIAKAIKGLEYIPNLERFNSMSLTDLKDIFGTAEGNKLHAFIFNSTRKEICAKNWETFYQENLKKTKERIKTKTKKEIEPSIKPIFDGEVFEYTEGETTPLKTRELQPQVKDLLEYIRQHDRGFADITKYFGFSPEYGLKELYKLKEQSKIWYNLEYKVWSFGHDKNPAPVIADEEMDVGV